MVDKPKEISRYFDSHICDFHKLGLKIIVMLPKGVHIKGVPPELEVQLKKDPKARAFFESLTKSYKQGYSDWVGSAKQESTRQTRAEKALIMLQNEQKTLKT